MTVAKNREIPSMPDRLESIDGLVAGDGSDIWLSIKDLVKLTGLHRATIYRAIARGTFPRHFTFGGRSLWKMSEYRQWRDQVTQH